MTNPKFMFFMLVQNSLYLRVLEINRNKQDMNIDTLTVDLFKFLIPYEIELKGEISRS